MYRKVCECESEGRRRCSVEEAPEETDATDCGWKARERERARENERVWKISRTEPNRLMREGERIKGEE